MNEISKMTMMAKKTGMNEMDVIAEMTDMSDICI